MTGHEVGISVSRWHGLWGEYSPLIPWHARLERFGEGKTELVAAATGRSYDFALDNDMFDAYDEISPEYGSMAFNVLESCILDSGYQSPLLIIDLVVAPKWRGHNIGPHLLRWMGVTVGNIGSIFLVPEPLPTRLDADGEWVTDWELPRAGSGAKRKVRAAYRRGGFTHLRGGTWWTALDSDEHEMARIQEVMSVLEQ